MIIERIDKPEFKITFSREEGWPILAALNEWIANHPDAANIHIWKKWAQDLDNYLRDKA